MYALHLPDRKCSPDEEILPISKFCGSNRTNDPDMGVPLGKKMPIRKVKFFLSHIPKDFDVPPNESAPTPRQPHARKPLASPMPSAARASDRCSSPDARN